MKKSLYITLAAFGVLGLGYLVYRKISDMNKEIIDEGTFTIKVDETASTEGFDYLDIDYYDLLAFLEEYESYGEEPSWTSPYDEYNSPYNEYMV